MRTISVSKLKARLSECVRAVKAGNEILVTERGRPVALLAPIPSKALPEHSRLAELARIGAVRIGSGKLPDGFWSWPRPKDPDSNGLKALLSDRDESR